MNADFYKKALDHIATHGWENFKPEDLKPYYGADGGQHFSSKQEFLKAFVGFLDEETLAHLPADLLTFDPKDRLFEVFMGRFEVAIPYKAGLLEIWNGETQSIGNLLSSAPLNLPLGIHTMETLLKAAGVISPSAFSCFQVHGFGLLYLGMVRTWLGDTTPDQQKTMAKVDQLLQTYGSYLLV